MPLPTPKKGEEQDDFIDRCMDTDVMKEDYPEEKQRLAVCYSQWRKTKKKREEDPDAEERGAIGSHSSSTTDEAWDGPANEARLKDDAEAGYYRKMFAWVDPKKDAKTKAAYKFPHHMVAEGGSIGAANTRACSAIIAVLNGGRGGSSIPSSDRRGVYNHAAKHLRDADKEVPDLREASLPIERRSFPMELRADGDGIIRGHAAVFGKKSLQMWGFVETVRRGAFAKTLKKADVRALFNHDPNYVLGRIKPGTLRLREDDKGLAVEIDPPDTQWARDLKVSIGRGDIGEMSFAFRPVVVQWTETPKDEPDLRELIEVELFDVSVVTFPAYLDTDVSIREWINDLTRAGLNVRLPGIIRLSLDGGPLGERDIAIIRESIGFLSHCLPAGSPGPEAARTAGDSTSAGTDPEAVPSAEKEKFKLRLAELELEMAAIDD